MLLAWLAVLACSGASLPKIPAPTTAPAATADDAYETPREIGADFEEDGPNMKLEPERFVPTLGQEEAETIAMREMMRGFGLPPGMGIEDLVVKKSTTALFSGIKGLGLGARVGPWDAHDREVWVVVLADLPISLPCGPELNSCSGVHAAQWNLILDANTGEVLAGLLTGGGPRSPRWDWSGIIGKIEATQIAERPLRATPTAAPE